MAAEEDEWQEPRLKDRIITKETLSKKKKEEKSREEV